jgi:hypothetical protein
MNGPLKPVRRRRIVFGAEKYLSIIDVSFIDLPEMANQCSRRSSNVMGSRHDPEYAEMQVNLFSGIPPSP